MKGQMVSSSSDQGLRYEEVDPQVPGPRDWINRSMKWPNSRHFDDRRPTTRSGPRPWAYGSKLPVGDRRRPGRHACGTGRPGIGFNSCGARAGAVFVPPARYCPPYAEHGAGACTLPHFGGRATTPS